MPTQTPQEHQLDFLAGTVEVLSRKNDELRSQLTAAQASLEEAKKDAERMNWCEKQWTSGLHIETCGASPGGNAESRKTATVYLGSHEYRAPTVRQAIDAARQGEVDDAHD